MKRFVVGFLLGAAAAVLLLVALGHFLAVEDPVAETDAIVALSGDAGVRTETAVALWRRGLAPLIVFAGAAEDPLSPPAAELMKRQAVAAGVPAESVVLEARSATTRENAQRVRDLLTEHRIRRAILVTSPYHQRRASWLFAKELDGTGITFTNYPARDPDWDATTWWTREPSRSLALVELAKLGAQLFGGVFRSGS
ncbi:MAG TPA: YdcF family protein [Candidatus Limnocylindria bacterium]|nr:YdcF family protein [Candidatus Limnocylindria bacterium]